VTFSGHRWATATFLPPARSGEGACVAEAEVIRAAVIRAFEDIFNKGNLDAIDDLFQPDVVFYSTALPDPSEPVRGREAYREFARGFLEGFSDVHFDIKGVVAEGDLVVVRAVGRATHTAEYQGIPPTGRTVELAEMIMVRGGVGKCAEAGSRLDPRGLRQQLGRAPRGRPPRAVLRVLVGIQRLAARRRGRRSAPA
jgi:predicted ester cyclase